MPKIVSFFLILALGLPNPAWALRAISAGDNAGLEEDLTRSLTVPGTEGTGTASPPTTGLEEPQLIFRYSGGLVDEMQLNARRENFEPLGLGGWIPPLNPLEAAVLKAFVHGNYSLLPGLYWAVGKEGRGLLLGIDPSEGMGIITLRRSEAAAFVNRLFDFQQSSDRFNPTAFHPHFRTAFRREVLYTDRRRFGEGDEMMKKEWRFWADRFTDLLRHLLNLRDLEGPFKLVGLVRIGERYYQPVPEDGRVQVPLRGVQRPIGIRIADVDLWFEWASDFENESDRPWRLVRSNGETLFTATGKRGNPDSVLLIGDDGTSWNIRRPTPPGNVVLLKSRYFKGYAVRIERQSARIGESRTAFLTISNEPNHSGNPWGAFIGRPLAQMADDQQSVADLEIQALALRRQDLEHRSILVRLLEILEWASEKEVIPFTEWDKGRDILSGIRPHLKGELTPSDSDQADEAFLNQLDSLLKPPLPWKLPIPRFYRELEARRQELGKLFSDFRSAHSVTPSHWFREKWSLRDDSGSAGLEEIAWEKGLKELHLEESPTLIVTPGYENLETDPWDLDASGNRVVSSQLLQDLIERGVDAVGFVPLVPPYGSDLRVDPKDLIWLPLDALPIEPEEARLEQALSLAQRKMILSWLERNRGTSMFRVSVGTYTDSKGHTGTMVFLTGHQSYLVPYRVLPPLDIKMRMGETVKRRFSFPRRWLFARLGFDAGAREKNRYHLALVRGKGEDWWIHLHLEPDIGLLFRLLLEEGRITGLTDPWAELLDPATEEFFPLTPPFVSEKAWQRLIQRAERAVKRRAALLERSIQNDRYGMYLAESMDPDGERVYMIWQKTVFRKPDPFEWIHRDSGRMYQPLVPQSGLEEVEEMSVVDFQEQYSAILASMGDLETRRVEEWLENGVARVTVISVPAVLPLYVHGEELFQRILEKFLPSPKPFGIRFTPVLLPTRSWQDLGLILEDRESVDQADNPRGLPVLRLSLDEVDKLDPVELVAEIFRSRLRIPQSNEIGAWTFVNRDGQAKLVLFITERSV